MVNCLIINNNLGRCFGHYNILFLITLLIFSCQNFSDISHAFYRSFSDGTAFQAFVSAMDYRGPKGRNTGGALAAALSVMKGAQGGGKKICFLFSTGKSTDDVSGPAKAIVKSGVSIFALGIGKFASRSEMKTISRYYLVTKWKGLLTAMVKVSNSLKRGMIANFSHDVIFRKTGSNY